MATKKRAKQSAKKAVGGGGAKKRLAPVAAREPVTFEEIDLGGGPAAVDKFRARAMALSAGVIKPLHGPAQLIAHNVTSGAAAVLAERSRAAKELPGLDLEAVSEVAELAVAVAWAAEEVFRYTEGSPTDVRGMVRRAGALRMSLLTNLDGAARAGIVPQRLVEQIRVGRGPFDTAGDCVACAKLFKTYATALKGKTPITAAQVAEAAALGTQLQTLLRPKGSRPKEKADALKAAIDLRDRLGVLLARAYDEVRRAGGWLFGEDRDERVPPPLAFARPRRSGTSPVAPTPPATTGSPPAASPPGPPPAPTVS